MDTLVQDLRYGVRRLLKSPAFTIIVVLTLALGIGANTAIFSVVNAILLRPLPYAQPERLVTIFHFYPNLNALEAPVSAPGYKKYRERTRSFESVAVQSGWSANLTRNGGEPERLRGSRVSADFFKVWGVQPALGRTLLPEEDAEGRNHVVVLSDGLWKRLYGSRRDVVGQNMQLNGESYQIVGVMPSSFRDYWNRRTELWTPIAIPMKTMLDDNNSTNEYLALSARLKPGVTEKVAAQEMQQFGETLKRELPSNFGPRWTLEVKSLNEQATGKLRPALLVLLGAVGFVLLIACANVANLLLARAAGRMKEIAVRAALGANRTRILRQLLTESIVLALAGGVGGLLLAYWGVQLIANMDQRNVPFARDVSIDQHVLLYTLGLALLTGILFGLVPAVQSLKSDVQETLRGEGRGTTSDRSGQLIRRSLVVAEIALALTLLTGAGLLIRSFAKLQDVQPGFNPSHLMTFDISLPKAKYPSDTAKAAFYASAVESLKQVPGVRSVGATSVMPFGGDWSTASFNIEGVQTPQGQPGPWGDIRIVTTDFAKTLEIPLLRGRLLTDADRSNTQAVVVVDQELVNRYFPKRDPIGGRITFNLQTGADSAKTQWITIVGVVKHTKHEGLDAENRIQVYLPVEQLVGSGFMPQSMSFAVRTVGNPVDVSGAARQAIRAADPDQPISNLNTMDELMGASLGQRRLSMVLLALFAGVAVVLASLGIYGVMSQLVTQRQRELGVRMALGAATNDVLGLVLRQGMTLAGVGLVIGFVGASGLTRLIRSQLFATNPTDPATFISVAGLIAAVAFLATGIPAWRAARLDPVRALREE